MTVREVPSEWSSSTISWNNQPNPPGQGINVASIKSFEGINKWRGSENIKDKAQQMIDNPTSHMGFTLDNVGPYNLTRSFTSMNSPLGRTATSLEQCPRLLLKVKTDVPLTPASIGTNVNMPNEFFSLYGTDPFLVFEMESGQDWPASWELDTQ